MFTIHVTHRWEEEKEGGREKGRKEEREGGMELGAAQVFRNRHFCIIRVYPANCLQPSRHGSAVSFPRLPHLFSLLTSPTHNAGAGVSQKDAEKKTNNCYKGFLIFLGFMNFGSIIQKLEFLTMRWETLNWFFIASSAPKTYCVLSSFTFPIKFKICLNWANIYSHLIHLLYEILKRQLNHYIKFSGL